MSKRKRSKLGTFIAAAAFIYFAYTIIIQQNMIYSKNSEIRNIQAKIRKEQKTNDELKKQAEILNTDEFYEKVAREKLGLVKPGEKVFIDINK